MSAAPHHAQIAVLGAQPRLVPLAGVALKIAVAATLWSERARSRRALAHLDDHLLRDIGLDRRDAWRESRRAFWQG